MTVSDDGRALYTSAEGVLLWSSNGKDVGGKGAPAPGSAEAEAEAAAPPAGDSDAHDPPMVEGGEAAPASVEQEGSGVVQMASIAASGGVADLPIEFVAEIKDTWERNGRTMYKIEVFITNKGQVRVVVVVVVVVFPFFSCREGFFSLERVVEQLKKKNPKISHFLFPSFLSRSPHPLPPPSTHTTPPGGGSNSLSNSQFPIHKLSRTQHNITSLDVVVPKREVVYESWGAAHDQGEDSGRRIFSVPQFIKEKGGITAGECYYFGGVFSEADPGFLVENFEAPS